MPVWVALLKFFGYMIAIILFLPVFLFVCLGVMIWVPMQFEYQLAEAVRMYERHPDAFEEVWLEFEDSLDDARRVGPKHEDGVSLEDFERFLEFRNHVDVESLGVGNGGWIEGDFVVDIGSYGFVFSGRSVGVTRLLDPSALASSENVVVSDSCDQPKRIDTSIPKGQSWRQTYCRLDENWFAFDARN